MHQNNQWIHIKVFRLNNMSSTSAASVPQFVVFSCLELQRDNASASVESYKKAINKIVRNLFVRQSLDTHAQLEQKMAAIEQENFAGIPFYCLSHLGL